MGFRPEDYSVLEMELQSPIFEKMREQLDKAIKDAIATVYSKEFESADLTLKLSIELPETFRNVLTHDEHGEEVVTQYKYRYPYFKHKITTDLKKKYVEEGRFDDDREVALGSDGETFIAIKYKDGQVRMDI